MNLACLTRNTGGDDNDVGTGQGTLEAIFLGKVAFYNLSTFSILICMRGLCSSYRWCGDV